MPRSLAAECCPKHFNTRGTCTCESADAFRRLVVHHRHGSASNYLHCVPESSISVETLMILTGLSHTRSAIYMSKGRLVSQGRKDPVLSRCAGVLFREKEPDLVGEI